MNNKPQISAVTASPVGGSSTGGTAEQPNFGTAIERVAGMMLKNRFLWLAFGITLLLLLQLSFLQMKLSRFNTLDLTSHLSVLIEAGLLACAMINIVSVPRLREAWLLRWPGARFNHAAAYLASGFVLTILLVMLLAPMLWLHRYPGLIAQGIRIPLMLLQRDLLLLMSVLVTSNIVISLRLYLRLPAVIFVPLGVAWHVAMGYYITVLSFNTEFFRRLNSVFYYNQLWHYMDKFPNLQRPEVVHNIETQFFAFFGSAALLVAFTMLLWLPKASQLTAREH